MDKKEKRFVVKETCRMFSGHIEIIVDTTTGVNYISKNQGFGGSITPLLDENGKVVVDKLK